MLTTNLLLIACTLQGPQETRSIEIDAKVEASSSEVFRLFSTSKGVRTLFPGADAWIGDAVGDPYHIAFMPEEDPQGERFGSHGCRIREKLANERIVFDWRGPENFAEMNQQPFPTWVEVEIIPDAENPAHSHVHLAHHGFKQNETWDEYRAWFQKAWQGSIDLVQLRYATQPTVDRRGLGKPANFILASLTPGPNWKAGKPAAQQPKMANHAAYMMTMLNKGELYMAGPLASQTEGFVIINTISWKRARNLLAADPAVQAGTFEFSLKNWMTSLPAAKD